MKIDDMALGGNYSIFYDPKFRNVLEDHMSVLRQHSGTRKLDLIHQHVYAYEFDFFGLLSEYNIPPEYRWIVMRMNGFLSPQDFPQTLSEIIVPDTTFVNQIRQSYESTNRFT